MKLLIGFGITIVCIVIGLIPEAIMYYLYGVIAPSTETSKLLTIGLFWLIGSGFCIFFAVIAVGLWLASIAALIDSK